MTSRGWGRTAAAIAAGILLFLAVTASLVFFATNQDDDETPTMLVAGQGTEQPTAQVNVAASITVSVTASPAESSVLTEPFRSAEAFLVYQKFIEPSSAGSRTPLSENFRSTTITVPWDGTGTIVLSGCRDRPCNIALDDEMRLIVTNADGTEPTIRIDDNGGWDGLAQTLPIVLTNLFRPGDNQVEVILVDKAGNQRGLKTDVYILILR